MDYRRGLTNRGVCGSNPAASKILSLIFSVDRKTNVREASPHKKTHIDANLSGRHRHISRPKSENRKSSFREWNTEKVEDGDEMKRIQRHLILYNVV